MSQVLNQELNKAEEKGYLQEIESLIVKLKENNKMIVRENKQIENLRKENDKSFIRLKKTVESLQTY